MTQARHPLTQPDLFQCVLDSIQGRYYDQREPRRTLLALAQTCHAFSEPSLDRLWRRLESLKPLIQCFSSVLSKERVSRFRSTSVFRSLFQKMPPSPSEWVIVRRYSHRIKELRISPLDQPFHDFLQSIDVSAESFLPNLRSVHWCPDLRYSHSSLWGYIASPPVEPLTGVLKHYPGQRGRCNISVVSCLLPSPLSELEVFYYHHYWTQDTLSGDNCVSL